MNKNGIGILFLICLTARPNFVVAQERALALEDCYLEAQQNYPLIKQHELLSRSQEYSIQNAQKGYLPQLNLYGQATYQSEVTSLPITIPGRDIPTLTKDQYKVYGEITQTIYDGGIIRHQQQSIEATTIVEEQKLEIELYKIKERINQLFFGVLIIDEQLKQNEILKQDIDQGIKKAQASVDNGVALKSSVSVLKAERLKADQRSAELNATRISYLDVLGLFIRQSLGESTTLLKPPLVIQTTEIHRPELLLFDYQNKALDIQNNIISAKNRPKVNLFFQGGYGKPALNILNTDFSPYYIGGIRLNWNISNFYTARNERSIIGINRKLIEIQKELFLLNSSFTIKQQNAEQLKFQQLLTTDEEIIELRASVKSSSLAQLENGVLNTSDYLRDVNAEDLARQNKLLHEIQLLMVQYNQKITTGN